MTGRIVGWTDPRFPHKCDPPSTSEKVEDFTVGTVWQCDCGKTHIVDFVTVHLVNNLAFLTWDTEGWFARKRRERRDAPRQTVGGYSAGGVVNTDRPMKTNFSKVQMKPPPDTSWMTTEDIGRWG